MSTEFEKPVPSLARPTAKSVPLTLAAVIAVCLITGLLAAVYYQAWAVVVTLFAGISATVGLVVLQFGELERYVTGKPVNFEWAMVEPDIQRQALSIEIDEIVKYLGIEDIQYNELLSTYIVAQDLALRQIQQEHRSAMTRHVSIDRVPFDAVIPNRNHVTCVEVSFLIKPELRQEKIDSMLRKIARVGKSFEARKIGLEPHLLVVLVTQLEPEGELRLRASLARKRFAETAGNIEIRFLDFESLQHNFLVMSDA